MQIGHGTTVKIYGKSTKTAQKHILTFLSGYAIFLLLGEMQIWFCVNAECM